MLVEEKIDNVIFVEQRTFYIYASEEDRKRGKYSLVTSDEILFLSKKEELKKRLVREEKINVII